MEELALVEPMEDVEELEELEGKRRRKLRFPRNYVNTAKISVSAFSDSRIDLFNGSKNSRYDQYETGEVSKPTIITSVIIKKAPGTPAADFETALYGATIRIEGNRGVVYLGTLDNLVWDGTSDKKNFRLPRGIFVPAGQKYTVIIEYLDNSKKNTLTSPVEMILRVEGVQAA